MIEHIIIVSVNLCLIYFAFRQFMLIISFRSGYQPSTNNACRMKRGLDGFWRARNQISVSNPSIFLLKNNKFWSAWRLEPTPAHSFTVITRSAIRQNDVMICMANFWIIYKAMLIMLQMSARSIFFFFS